MISASVKSDIRKQGNYLRSGEVREKSGKMKVEKVGHPAIIFCCYCLVFSNALSLM